METKTCWKCHQDLPVDDFSWTTAQHKYRKRTCKKCRMSDSLRTRQRRYYHNNRESQLAYKRVLRQQNVPYAIHTDSRRSDRKNGRDNDLTKEFIAAEITKGCSYCGETEIRMTLDRIDNDKGHLQDNVVPACIRCNYTRKNMPYEAWLIVAKGMRKARKAGLFNG